MKLGAFFATCIYITGIILAQGFWSTLFAVIIPFYAWYLVLARIAEKFLQ